GCDASRIIETEQSEEYFSLGRELYHRFSARPRRHPHVAVRVDRHAVWGAGDREYSHRGAVGSETPESATRGRDPGAARGVNGDPDRPLRGDVEILAASAQVESDDGAGERRRDPDFVLDLRRGVATP